MDCTDAPTRRPRVRGLVAAASLTVALATAATALPAAAQSDEDAPPPTVSAVPIPAGQVDAAIAQLDGVAADMLARTGVPGMAIAVVHRDRLMYAKGFGVRNTQTGAPVTPNTVFQLASVSKPVGATVVSRAVGEGVVSWDTRLIEHLPWFRLKSPSTTRQVTLADMYSHRSGLPDHAGDLLEDLGYRRNQVLRRLRYLPLHPFRAEYAYTNFGLTAAAEAVARAARTPWDRLSSRLLYEPLGMTSTSSRHADYAAAPERADLHVKEGDQWVPRFDRRPDPQSPAGGVSSTLLDMAKWMRLMLAEGSYDGRQVVAAEPLAQMSTPHILSNPPAVPAARSGFYGLGLNIGNDWTARVRLNHSGAFALGAATVVNMLPAEELGIVVLTNGAPIGLPEAVAHTFLDLAETGRAERDWLAAYGQAFAGLSEPAGRLAGQERPANPRPARRAAAYVGTYRNRYYGPARVVRRGGGLAIRLGALREALPLTHWSGDTFTYMPPGEMASGISAVTFTRPRGGRPRAVTLENLDAEGLGTFRRR
ncbi:MAG TPA: serine hydrolase [Capillimicrobium sp.]|nr:serine hydrolase [Capillimicrobium sp.]